MAADGITVKLEGIDDLKKALQDLPKKIRTQALRKALREGAKAVQREARRLAPVLQIATPRRKPGTLKKNIVIRASKFARRAGDEGVFVSVRPLSGARQKKLGKAGAANPNDPYYWWFQEFGFTAVGRSRIKGGKIRRFLQRVSRAKQGQARAIPGKRFLTTAAKSKGEEAIKTFMSTAIPIINKLNTKA